MLLTDPKLAFARDLIEHWTSIRNGALVPLKSRIDPGAMRRSLPFITLADIANPGTPKVMLAGTGLRQRYGAEITGADWSKFVPQKWRPLLRLVNLEIAGRPCGIYYIFKISADGRVVREVETVALPLRIDPDGAPSMLITHSRDVRIQGVAGTSLVDPDKVSFIALDFVDIGAGSPDGLPAGAAFPADA